MKSDEVRSGLSSHVVEVGKPNQNIATKMFKPSVNFLHVN